MGSLKVNLWMMGYRWNIWIRGYPMPNRWYQSPGWISLGKMWGIQGQMGTGETPKFAGKPWKTTPGRLVARDIPVQHVGRLLHLVQRALPHRHHPNLPVSGLPTRSRTFLSKKQAPLSWRPFIKNPAARP